MRKVLSFVLVLSLVLGSFGMAFAAPLSDVAGEKSEEAVKVLTELGVVSGYPDGTYKPGNIVTRAEMAVIVVRALGLADYATGTSSFSDMGGHWSNPYVAYATSLGIISGYPDGTFRPDKTVSYDEAATMLVAALGYNADSLIGTWPANFVTKAKTLGILDGIKAGPAGANRGDIAIMTYQALDQAIGKTNKDGDFVYDKDSDGNATDTMLARLGAELYEDPEQFVDAETGYAFVVDGEEDSIINLKPFLGAYVVAYANSDGDIIAIKEVKSVYLTGDYDDARNLFKADKDYNFADELKGVAVPYFDNGVTEGTASITDHASDVTIAAKVSGKKVTEIYSIATWTVNDDFLFEDGMLEDDNLDGNDFVLDDNDEIDLASFALVGVASLEDIDEDNVVYVYKNADGIAKIEVGTEVVTGDITKISNDDKKITVNGSVYKYAADNIDALSNAVASGSVGVGDTVTLKLDVNGYIYDLETEGSEGGNYAVLLETDDADPGLKGSDAVVKLFLSDGTAKVFDVDAKEIDDALISDAGEWKEGYKGGAGAGILVEYGLDKDGVIDYLVDLTEEDDYDTAGETEFTVKGYYNGVPVSSSAVLFTYEASNPEDKSDEDCYGVTTVAKAKESKFAAGYYAEKNNILVMLLDGVGATDDEVYGVVIDWAKTSASDTDYMVTMLIDGVETDYDVKKSVYDNLQDGTYDTATLYELTLNASGEITALGSADSIELEAEFTVATYVHGAVSDGDTITKTVDKEAVAYMWNVDDGVFEKVSVSKANLVYNKVTLYDADGDGVADILLIVKPGV